MPLNRKKEGSDESGWVGAVHLKREECRIAEQWVGPALRPS